MPVSFYSFTDPRELERFEVCWCQSAQTRAELSECVAPPPSIGRPGPRPGHDYGSIRHAILRILTTDGPQTLSDLADALDFRRVQINGACLSLWRLGVITRERGHYRLGQDRA